MNRRPCGARRDPCMNTPAVRAGLFLDAHPFVATTAGSGPPLVVLPPIRDTFEDIRSARWCRTWLRRLAGCGRPVVMIGRPRNLPPGCTTDDMARSCIPVLERCTGAVDLLGASLGGLVAQHVAAQRPDLVTRLVLAASGARIHSEARARMQEWITLAGQDRWHEVLLRIAALMRTGLDRQTLLESSALLGGALQAHPAAPQDFITCVCASRAHDSRPLLGSITAPALLIGGDRDSLFPPDVLQATAAAMPNARVQVIAGAGHGVFDERKRLFDRAVRDFIGHPVAGTPDPSTVQPWHRE